MTTPELTAADFRETAAAIEAEVGKMIVGQADVVRHVLVAILAGAVMLLRQKARDANAEPS